MSNVHFTPDGSTYHLYRDCRHLSGVNSARIRSEADVPGLRERFGSLMAPAPSSTRSLCQTCAQRSEGNDE